MKKSVRIRKAKPGETPGYKNKTKQFLQKANLGMNVTDPNSAQSVLNKIYDIAYTDLKLDTPDDVVFLDLTNRYGVDEQTALMIMQAVIAKLTEEGYRNDDALNPPANPEEETQQQQVNQDQMSAEDQEQEELAMSDFGYYDQGDDDRSYIDQYAMSGMEEDQQGQSFGGYYQDGGMTEEQQVLNQYGTPGNLPAQKPFSIEDLMAITPGIQNNPVFPDINSYIGDYGSTGWSNQNWLAKKGGSVPKLPKARLGFNAPAPIKRGYNWVNKIQPMQNLSGINRALVAPLTTGLGYGMNKLPWIGSKFQPQLNTSFTQNAYELPKVLMGEEPAAGIFTRRSEGWDDGSFLVDRLELAKDDIAAIINEAADGRSSFEVSELNDYRGSKATSLYGSIGGVYPANARINTGMDDAGNTFFEISHKFKPGERTAHGFVPTEAKETTFRNRFYYGTNDTGELQVFDNAGNPLIENEFTAFQVKRPAIPSFSKTGGDLYIRDFKNPVYGQQQTAPISNVFKDNFNQMFNRTDLTGLPPTAFKDLGLGGKLYRGLEQYATGAWMPSMFGYNPIRTRAKNITQANIPTLQYTNPATQATYPLGESNYAQDIKNATNYYTRLGRKTALGLGLAGYVGYNAYDAFMYPCQCEDPAAPNYMELDGFGKCPCGTDVGESRTLDPSAVEVVPTAPVEEIDADTMQFLIDQGIEPTDYNYYLNQNNPYVPYEIGEDPDPGNKKKGGNVSKKKFVKRLVSILEEGGSNEVGKGDRQDTATKDIEKMKSGFLENLKTNSNKAISAELYDKAKNHPQIMEKLMANGYKENLAEEAPVEAKWGMNINTGGYVVKKRHGGNTDYFSYSPFSYHGDTPGIERFDTANPTTNITFGRRNLAPVLANRSGFESIGASLTSKLPYKNNTGVGVQGDVHFVGDRWKALENVTKANTELDLSGGYDPKLGPYASLIASPQFAFSNMQVRPNANVREGQFIAKVGPYAGATWTPGRELREERASIPAGVKGSVEYGLGRSGATTGLSGYFGTDVFGKSAGVDNPMGRTQYGVQANLTIPFGRKQKRDFMNLFSSNDTKPDPGSTPKFQGGGYVDMGAENPLTKFISGGMETNYYEPYDIPMAKGGIQISDRAGNTKMVTEEEAEMWYEALNDNPDLSFTDLGFASDSPYMQQNQGSQGQCPPGSYWNPQYNMCVPRASVSYNPVKGPTTAGGLFGTLFPANVFNQRVYPGRNPYVTNILGNPVATDVYKTNWRGKPKKYLNIYQVPGTGEFNMADLNAFREGLDTSGGGRAAKDMFTDAKDMFRNVQDEVQDYGESRKDNRYQKYLGDQYGEDYWYGDRGDDPYKYEADFYTQGNEAVPGTKSQKQLDKLYAKEDRGRLREARQDQRQYNRDMRQADKKQAKKIRQYRRKQDFEYGGMMPMAGNGFAMEDDFGADQQNQGYSNPFAPKSEQIFNNPMFQGTPFQGMSMTGTGQYANNQTVEQIQEDAEKQGQQTNQFVAVEDETFKPRDFQAGLNVFNAAGRGVLGAIQRGQMNKTNRNQLMDTTDVFNNYANKTSKDRGDWADFGSMAGMFRYDQEGQDRSSRATYGQYGGYMEQGGTHKMFNGLNMRNSDHKHYEEDEVVYMTPEEIEQYLAAGGQIEYL